MKKWVMVLLVCVLVIVGTHTSFAQCAVCTKTASQLGVKPAKGLNTAIIYLMITPFLLGGVLGYRWWKSNRSE